MINITFPDGSVKPFEKGITGYEIAMGISPRLAKEVLSVGVNDKIKDLNFPITEDSRIQLFKWEDKQGKAAFWHSSAHVLAQVILDFYPNAKLTIGPSIEMGFYYDVDLGEDSITDKDFGKLEKQFLKRVSEKAEFKMRHVTKKEATDYYAVRNNEYKIELIEGLEEGNITFCDHSDFTDLCRGGHILNTGLIKAVKITSVAGAYWRGDEKRQQLTRVYGISFPKKSMLDDYLLMLEEAKKRDHRKLGKEMEFFTFSQKVGLGLPLWLPRGAIMRFQLEDFLRKRLNESGYYPVVTPHIGSKNLYETSGHYAKYGKDSFQPIHTPQEGEEYMLKPMNCPHHCEIYRSAPRSYRDLPLRLAEFGTVYRYEQSGELHGLTRVRSFTQDDAHMFVRPEQLKDEFKKVIDLILYVFRVFKFENFTAQISLRDKENREKYIGSEENWEKAENAIIESAKEKGLPAVIEYGEAAFYGPKLDFMVKDALGREWQLGTIQVDYNLPERFELEYTDDDGAKKRPVMIHRAPFGSMERFSAVLLEHTAGHLPIWLAPEQVKILPVSEKYSEYAEKVCKLMNNSDIRSSVDDRNETLGKRIREISLLRVPIIVIVGEKEMTENTVSIRMRGENVESKSVEEFINWFTALTREELK